MKVIFIYEDNGPALKSSPMSPEEALKALLHWDCPNVPREGEGQPTRTVSQ